MKKIKRRPENGIGLDFRYLTLTAAFLLTGCVWAGYQSTPPGYVPIGANPGPVITLQNLDDGEFQANAIEAVKISKLVLEHPDFESELVKQSLLPTCESDDRVSGTEVFESLGDARPFSLVARKPWNAVAVADIVRQRVAVKKSRFRNWNGTPEERGEFIETLVHEMTHMILVDPESPEAGRLQSRYKDDGHGTRFCPDQELVSYYVGDLAKKVFLANHQDLIP